MKSKSDPELDFGCWLWICIYPDYVFMEWGNWGKKKTRETPGTHYMQVGDTCYKVNEYTTIVAAS